MGEKQFKKIRKQEREQAARDANQQPGTPISQLPPNIPGARSYRMLVDGQEKWIEEKDLTRVHMAMLAQEFTQFFLYLPDTAQDMFLAWVDQKVNEEMMRQKIGRALHDQERMAGLHEGNVSEGGIILPDNVDPHGNPAAKIIRFDE